MARSALVATTEHVVGMATSSSMHLQGMVEDALEVAAGQVIAAGGAQLRVALGDSHLDPNGAATPTHCPSGMPPYLPASCGGVPALQETSEEAPPQLQLPLAATLILYLP